MPRPKRLREIKAVSIQIGDLLRVSGKMGDIDISRVGKVVKREHQARATVYLTKENQELFMVHGDGTMSAGYGTITKITLINRNPDPTLF